jgi:uncharacterized protein
MNLYDRINNVLLEYANDEDAAILDASELDGYFFAIGCAPQIIPPSKWIPMIWGGELHAPEWPDMTTAQSFIADVMHHYNDVMQQLNRNECSPLFNVYEEAGRDILIAEEWCEGFRRGIVLIGNATDKLADDLDLIAPIMLFSSEELDEKRDQLSDKEIEEYMNMIPGCVIAIRHLLGAPAAPQVRTGRSYVEPFTHTAPRPGRNELCPCDSGKKYKKCCGAN